MKPTDLIGLALSRLGTGKLRTALTMLGIIIGVASVVALVSVAQGATKGISDRLQSLGTNLLTVSPGFSTNRRYPRRVRLRDHAHGRRRQRAGPAGRRAGSRATTHDQQARDRRDAERNRPSHRNHTRLLVGLRLPDVGGLVPEPGIRRPQHAGRGDRRNHGGQPESDRELGRDRPSTSAACRSS